MNVLLSIRPIHADNILAGIKTFEFRRKIFKNQTVKTVLIYSTKPVGMLVGEFDIDNIIEATPEQLWKQTSDGSGITKSYFDDYFEGRNKAFALKIGAVRVFDRPLAPSEIFPDFTPPQSYMYVPRKLDTAHDQLRLI